MIFPRLNACSLWLVFGSVTLMCLAMFIEGGVNAGWTFYVPLSIYRYIRSGFIFSLLSLISVILCTITLTFSINNIILLLNFISIIVNLSFILLLIVELINLTLLVLLVYVSLLMILFIVQQCIDPVLRYCWLVKHFTLCYFRENRLKDGNSSNITVNYGTSMSALSLPSYL